MAKNLKYPKVTNNASGGFLLPGKIQSGFSQLQHEQTDFKDLSYVSETIPLIDKILQSLGFNLERFSVNVDTLNTRVDLQVRFKGKPENKTFLEKMKKAFLIHSVKGEVDIDETNIN